VVAFRTSTIKVAGVEIGAPKAGKGDTVVYLHDILGDIHGQPEGTEDSLAFLNALSKDFQVVAPALPGYPASADAQNDVYDLEDMGVLYDDLLAKIGGGEPVSVVGLGLGAWVAAEVATRNPERIAKLVLISPVGISLSDQPINRLIFPAFSPRGRSGFAEMRTLLFTDPEAPLGKRLVPDPPNSPDWQRTMRFAGKGAARIGWKPQFLYNRRLPDRLRRVKAKTLIIGSRNDQLVPFANFEAYKAGIKGARLIEMEGSHMLPFDQPAKVAAAVSKFLKA
jgi:pimeloyl-ACP methyl ester carboxylesterase